MDEAGFRYDMLKPCPFCGHLNGEASTMVEPNGRIWNGMRWGSAASYSIRHWCPRVPGQPHRMIERVGADLEAAIEAWNQRA